MVEDAHVCEMCRYEGNPLASPSKGSGKKPNVGLIAGAAGGGVVVAVILVGLLVFFCRSRKRSAKNSPTPIPVFKPAAQAPRISGTQNSQLDTTLCFNHQRKVELYIVLHAFDCRQFKALLLFWISSYSEC